MPGRAAIAAWLKGVLAETGWDQKYLAERAGTNDTNISELKNKKQDLTAEMAQKLASVSELHTTREALLDMFFNAGKPSHTEQEKIRREAAMATFDRLSKNAQELATDLMISLEKRERDK